MSLKLLKDCELGSAGDVVDVDDADKAQAYITLGVAESADAPSEPSTEAVEKAFIEKNEKALEQKAKAIRSDFKNDMEVQMKALRETVEKQSAEINQLRLKAPAPDFGNPAIKPDNKFGFKSLGDAAQTMFKAGEGNEDFASRWGIYTKALKSKFPTYGKKSATLNITDDTAPVPPDFAKTFWEPKFGTPFLYQHCTPLTTDTGSINAPYIKDTDHTSSIGGVTVTSLDPDSDTGNPITESKVGVGNKLVQLELFGALCNVSEQMKRWSPYNMGALMGSWMQNAAMFEIENRFNNSTSYGWRYSTTTNPMLYKIQRKTANKIQFVDLTNMLAVFSDPYNASMEGCFIVITQKNRFTQLGTMTFPDSSGTYPAYLPGGGVMNGNAPSLSRIEGLEIISTEFASALGSEGDVAIISPKNYYSLRNINPETGIEESIWFRFNKGGSSLRLIVECAFACPANGKFKNKAGDYVSPFVVLDDVVSSGPGPF